MNTVRERIMTNVTDRFREATIGDPANNVKWDIVTRLPLGERDYTYAEHMVGLFDIKETKKHEIGYTICSLVVRVEFWFQPKMGDAPETYMHNLMGEVQRTFLSDPNHGDLALDSVELDNELDLEADQTKVTAGLVTFGVTYRHKVNDPFKLIGE